MRRFAMLAAMALSLLAVPATAQTAPPPAAAAPAQPSPALRQRAEQLPAVLSGRVAPSDYFSPDFLAAIPEAQIRPLFASLQSQFGAPQSLTALTADGGGNSGTATVAMANGVVRLAIVLGPNGTVAGLRILDAQRSGDTAGALARDIAALPGVTAWGLYRLGRDGQTRIAGSNGTMPLAIGSTFKLTILGTLDAEIAAGRMRWSDVIRLDRHSIPSGQLQNWPLGAPVTLHTLASLMISISDNSATDLLLRHLGRDRVEAFARAHGGLDGPHAFPILGTREATVLKNPALGPLRDAWLAGDTDARRTLLRNRQAELDAALADPAVFANRIADIDRIEWFASPDSLARLLGWYNSSASDDARAILAISPVLGDSAAAPWRYVGSKGGSEPGVIAMAMLLQGTGDNAFAVVMLWNNPAAAVDNAALLGLSTRGAAILAAPPG